MILFNIIAPTGWTVGLVRVEDVAVGVAVSLAVGVLFWPRGVGDLLRDSLGAAYARSAEYVASAAARLAGSGGAGWTESDIQSARTSARGASSRLDDAFREYLAESSAQRANLERVATMVSGATRVRLAAYSLSTLTPASTGGPRLEQCAAALGADVDALRYWYVSLADALIERKEVPPPRPRDDDERTEVVRCVRQVVAAGDGSMVGPALSLLWAGEHLDNLWQLGADLIQAADEFSSKGARPRHRALRGVLHIRRDGAPIRF